MLIEKHYQKILTFNIRRKKEVYFDRKEKMIESQIGAASKAISPHLLPCFLACLSVGPSRSPSMKENLKINSICKEFNQVTFN